MIKTIYSQSDVPQLLRDLPLMGIEKYHEEIKPLLGIIENEVYIELSIDQHYHVLTGGTIDDYPGLSPSHILGYIHRVHTSTVDHHMTRRERVVADWIQHLIKTEGPAHCTTNLYKSLLRLNQMSQELVYTEYYKPLPDTKFGIRHTTKTSESIRLNHVYHKTVKKYNR